MSTETDVVDPRGFARFQYTMSFVGMIFIAIAPSVYLKVPKYI